MGDQPIKMSDQAEPLLYEDLSKIRLKAYRNGNWRRLKGVEKAFFNASMQLAKLRGRIVNPSLLKAIKNIVLKLLQTPATRVLRMGRQHASHLLELYSRNGVVKWLPSVKSWLNDPKYLFWLGVNQTSLRSLGYL